MPRQARIDIPDSLYHVIARGIERRKIFKDELDYEDFLRRLDQGLKRTESKCLAYSLLGNHFHLLILRGRRPLAELMRRLMTGYAVNFNLRHKRVGHLFQNRYKAILCDYHAYVLELVAYIHLNPLRSGLVDSLRDLRKYRWCGHGALMGEFRAEFLAQAEVLEKFGNDLGRARKNYEIFIRERVGKYKKGELSAGGLKRSHGVTGTLSVLREEEKELSDARILGDGDFVETVLNLNEREQNHGFISREKIAGMVWTKTGIGLDEIRSLSRVRKIAKARALYCFLAKEKGGLSGSELMKDLRLTSGAVSHLVSVGRKIVPLRNN